jgi:hypothetical protein
MFRIHTLCLYRGVGQEDDLSGQQTAGACAQVGKTERGRHRVYAAFSVPTDQPLKQKSLNPKIRLVFPLQRQTAGACAQVGKTERGRHRIDAAFSVPTDQPLKTIYFKSKNTAGFPFTETF